MRGPGTADRDVVLYMVDNGTSPTPERLYLLNLPLLLSSSPWNTQSLFLVLLDTLRCSEKRRRLLLCVLITAGQTRNRHLLHVNEGVQIWRTRSLMLSLIQLKLLKWDKCRLEPAIQLASTATKVTLLLVKVP